MPNVDQILSLARAILAIVGTSVVAHGTVTAAMWEQIVGVVVMALPMVWSMFVHSDSGKLAAVEAMPDVSKIIVTPMAAGAVAEAAGDTSRPKVTT